MEQTVELAQMMAAREQRVYRQRELLEQYNATLVCFTMNIAGPIKNDALIARGFAQGNRLLRGRLAAAKAELLFAEQSEADTGCEAFYAVRAKPQMLKQLAVELEESSELGRLFDIDVLDVTGQKLERGQPRRCLLCGKPAQQCARNRTHTVEELQRKTRRILTKELAEADAAEVAQLACRSLLYEVCTTPKPGLVDRANSGSHKDMDIFTFMASSAALWPYFGRCTKIGLATAKAPAPETFACLRGRLRPICWQLPAVSTPTRVQFFRWVSSVLRWGGCQEHSGVRRRLC